MRCVQGSMIDLSRDKMIRNLSTKPVQFVFFLESFFGVVFSPSCSDAISTSAATLAFQKRIVELAE